MTLDDDVCFCFENHIEVRWSSSKPDLNEAFDGPVPLSVSGLTIYLHPFLGLTTLSQVLLLFYTHTEDGGFFG